MFPCRPFIKLKWHNAGIAFCLMGVCCCSSFDIDRQDSDGSQIASNDICDYFYLDITTNSIASSKTYGVSRYIDCDGARSLKIKAIRSKNSHLGVVFYDDDKMVINSIPFKDRIADGDNMISVEVPSGACFFRTSYYNSSVQYKKKDSFEYLLADYHCNRYRKYQSGNIYFSVNVIQDFDYYSKGDEGKNVLATTSVLTLPKNYNPEGEPVPIIMYCHGYSHYVYYDTWGSTESFSKQKQHWTDMGFAVFDTNGARNNNKQAAFYSAGAPQFVEAMRLTYEYVVTHYNVSDTIYIVGGSAGGPLALNYARFNGNVKAVALLSPWTDLYDCIWQRGCRSIFEEFYGFPGEDVYYSDIVEYYDPSKNTDDFTAPIKIWISSLEKGGLIYRECNEFRKAMESSGKDIDFEEVPGLEHSELVSGANEYIDRSVAEWFKSI